MSYIKKLIILSLFFTYLSASSLQNNVKNFVGSHKYNVNKYLILNIFKDKKSFYKHGRLNYVKIFDTLKNNGLFNVNYKSVQDVNIEIYSNAKTVKTIKSIKDVLLNLGYSYYFTKNIKKEENKLSWEIYFKSESVLDPLAFIKELNKLNIRVNDVKRITSTKWAYKIDVNYANISNSIKVTKDEIKKLRKPHRDYVLEVNNINTLYVTSHRLNQWYPSIAFYDKDFNLIKLDEQSSIKKKIIMDVPQGTKFISISDTYNLINIKRGITVTVN
jgi:hypothetical protein